MKEIFSSATKMVLLLFAIVLSLTLSAVVYKNIQDEQVVNGILTLFQNAVIAVIAFYFGQKQNTSNPPKQ